MGVVVMAAALEDQGMGTVIAFPLAPEAPRRTLSARRRKELGGPKIVILPVVRIERHGQIDDVHMEPMAGEGAQGRFDAARAPRGMGPAGRRY